MGSCGMGTVTEIKRIGGIGENSLKQMENESSNSRLKLQANQICAQRCSRQSLLKSVLCSLSILRYFNYYAVFV